MYKARFIILLVLLVLFFVSCSTAQKKVKADKIIFNAKIYTSCKDNLYATSCVIKDGKFIYVGDESGLDKYEGKKIDMKGKFIMPAIIDGHAHIPLSITADYKMQPILIECSNKSECLEFIKNAIQKDPNKERYDFMLFAASLNGDKLNKDELDSVTGDKQVVVFDSEMHSLWANTKLLRHFNISDDPVDMVPGLSMYERDENGKFTGGLVEMTGADILLSAANNITDEQIKASLDRFINFCKEYGVGSVFDAGTPGGEEFQERTYKILCDMDKQGKLPITFEGCYTAYTPEKLNKSIEMLKKYVKIFNTEHMKVRTLKIFGDGTVGNNTAGMLTPYADMPNSYGGCLFDSYDLTKLLKDLNTAGFNLHIHCVGERTLKQILDSVEKVKQELGDKFKINVTCAHIEHARDEDLLRMGKLGVMADFTPWWDGLPDGGPGGFDVLVRKLGLQRASNKFKSKTVARGGALVGFSSDNISFDDFVTWSPFLGIETGMTRISSDKSRLPKQYMINRPLPPEDERMTLDEMLQGYTSINSIILELPNKGAVVAGRDADYLVFEKDLTKEEHIGFSHNLPSEVYFRGVKVK